MFYIFLIAALNIGLGYALANYVYRHRFSGEMIIVSAPTIAQPEKAKVENTKTPEVKQQQTEPDPPPQAESKPQKQQEENQNSPTDEEPAEQETALLSQTIHHFQDNLENFHQSVVDLDSEARASDGNNEAYRKCITDLRAMNQKYVDQQQETLQVAEENQASLNSLGEASAHLIQAIQSQSASSAEADNLLETLQQEDVEQGQAKLVDQLSQQFKRANELRDLLENAAVKVLRIESDTNPQDLEDSPTSDQIRLHTILNKWWADDPERLRSLVLVMIDLDRFDEVNQRVGPQVGNLVIQAVEKMLKPIGDEYQGTAARIQGQRFVFFLPDADPRTLADQIEHHRQTLALCKFKQAEITVEITVSCAVIGVMAKDTNETLLARAEETLIEAKQKGRNQTFLHEGKYPAPCTPPELEISEQVIEI